jgi:xanthine dehydrogenase accessory factor
MLRVLAKTVERVEAERTRAAIATVIAVSGSCPQEPGARLVLFADGSTLGTVGGGAIELEVLGVLREVLTQGGTLTLSRHLTKQLGMCCGGAMEFFVEVLRPPPRVVLFGAGHVAREIAVVAQVAGFEVTVVDEREDWNTESRFPGCRRLVQDGEDGLRGGNLPIAAEDYVVVCTHDHRLDTDILRRCAPLPRAYLGMIGSRRKVAFVLQRISLQYPALDLTQIHAPIGLPLGGRAPGEIAVAVVAQLIQVRRGAQTSHVAARHEHGVPARGMDEVD